MKRLLPLLVAMLCMLPAHARERLTEIPTVYIDTEGSATVTGKSNYVKGTLTVMSADPAECCDALPMGVRGRGNSTWNMPKKPYRVKFDSKVNFLDLPAKAKSWVFLANYADKSLMRNAIAFEISSFVGMEYTPSIRFVDVVLNGEYLGNYMVTDQTEVAKGRVPVESQEVTDTEEPAITGGYLIELDGFADGEPVWFQTPQGIKVTVKYPKDDEINEAQLDYITRYVREFESRLFADNFSDPAAGYRSMADTESLVNWYIACELTANSDSFWSTYMYKKRGDDRLYFGPMWDYDIAFNNDSRIGDATRKLMRDSAHAPLTWIKRLWQDAWFRSAVNARWKELVDSGIEEYLLGKVEDYAALIDASQKLNFKKWDILSRKVYNELVVFPTYREGVDYLKSFISARVAFLTESFAADDPTGWAVDIDTSVQYRLMHSAGSWLSESAATCILSSGEDASTVTFVPSASTPGAYGILLPSGSYMGSDNKWNVIKFDDCSAAHALFSVEPTSDGSYVRLRNHGLNRYLGVDGTEPGGGIYTDKKIDYDRNRWRLREVGPVDRVTDAVTDADVREVRVYGVDGVQARVARSLPVDMSGLAPGVYVVTVTYSDGTVARYKLGR